MADSWFESVDQPSAPERSDAPRARTVPDNDGRANGEAVLRHRGLVIAVALGFVVMIASAVAYLVNVTNNANEDAVAVPLAGETSTIEPAPEDPDSAIGVAGDCRPDSGEVAVSTDDDNVRGAVAQWQEAYYSRDAEGLTDSIAAGSWLLNNDWPTILEEAAPDGTTWCAVMSPLDDPTVVDVDVTVSFADGESETYPQRVSGVQVDGRWLINDVETREG